MRLSVLLFLTLLLMSVWLALTTSSALPDPSVKSGMKADPADLVLLFEPSEGGWSIVNVERGTRERVFHESYWDFRRSPDGSRVAYPCSGALCVVRVDRQSRRVVISPPPGGASEASFPTWSPDGRQIAVRWSKGDPSATDIWTVNTDGSHYRRVAHPGGEARQAFWSPDGSSIAYSVASRGIYVIRSDGSARRQIMSEHGAATVDPLWSPQGSLIAYVQDADTPRDGIYVVRPDGSQRRRLVKLLRNDAEYGRLPGAVSWSSDGRSLTYAKYANGAVSAFVIEVKTGRQTRLGPGTANFAPHAAAMVFSTDAPIGNTLYRGRLTLLRPGTTSRPLLDEHVSTYAWSSDGKRLAYTKQNGLWVIDLATRTRHHVLSWHTPSTHYKGPLIWG